MKARNTWAGHLVSACCKAEYTAHDFFSRSSLPAPATPEEMKKPAGHEAGRLLFWRRAGARAGSIVLENRHHAKQCFAQARDIDLIAPLRGRRDAGGLAG